MSSKPDLLSMWLPAVLDAAGRGEPFFGIAHPDSGAIRMPTLPCSRAEQACSPVREPEVEPNQGQDTQAD